MLVQVQRYGSPIQLQSLARSRFRRAVAVIMAGLLLIVWGTGTGSEVMSRIAAPMVGGMISSTVLTLAVIPAIYALVKQRKFFPPCIAAVPVP